MEGFGTNRAGSCYYMSMTNHGLDAEEKFWAEISDAVLDAMEASMGKDTEEMTDAEYAAVGGAVLQVIKSALNLAKYENTEPEFSANAN